jgi:hypothetical protein
MKRKALARPMFECRMAGSLYKMEASYERAAYHLCDRAEFQRHPKDGVIPVYVIRESDLPEAVERMAETLCCAINWDAMQPGLKAIYLHSARAALTAILPAKAVKALTKK